MGMRSTLQIWSISAACWDKTDMYCVSAHFSFLWEWRCAGRQGVELHFHTALDVDQLGDQDAAQTALPPSLWPAAGLNLESFSNLYFLHHYVICVKAHNKTHK